LATVNGMTRDQVHVGTDPNFDGGREGIIADPDGDQMGISRDTSSEYPFHVESLKKDPDPNMKKFNQLFDGKK